MLPSADFHHEDGTARQSQTLHGVPPPHGALTAAGHQTAQIDRFSSVLNKFMCLEETLLDQLVQALCHKACQ